jgi:hypothetical protein
MPQVASRSRERWKSADSAGSSAGICKAILRSAGGVARVATMAAMAWRRLSSPVRHPGVRITEVAPPAVPAG